MAADTTSKSLQGISELTLVADIKPGLVRALDTRSHLSRVKTVMATLQGLRSASREWALVRPLSDAVERIQTIHTFRVAVLDGERLLLAVTFDRPWEPYIRFIWDDLGPLLDLLFCNCVDYPLAATSSLAKYSQWIRAKQIDTDFFYAAGASTVSDLQYLRQLERLAVSDTLGEITALRFERPEAMAKRLADADRPEAIRQGLSALAVLHRLRDLYPDPREDDGILRRAADVLLRELKQAPLRAQLDAAAASPRFKPAIDWFLQDLPAPQAPQSLRGFDPADVQGGILSAYKMARQACLLLIEINAARALDELLGRIVITTDAAAASRDPGLRTNIAFTLNGLRKLGLSAAEVERLPKEFREGMEARAGLLGDVRGNHPRRWQLPRRRRATGPVSAGSAADAPRADDQVMLSTVDIVLQLRWVGASSEAAVDADFMDHPEHPLRQAVDALFAPRLDAPLGYALLSLQPMVSHRNAAGKTVGHFGLVDGLSQPSLSSDPGSAQAGKVWDDQVRPGEILLGYPNDHGDVPSADGSQALLANGSFLVLRKLRQNTRALAQLKARGKDQGIAPDTLMAKLLGRWPSGQALAGADRAAHLDSAGAPSNDFDYADDPDGQRCPFQSHVRRANPRQTEPGRPIPRLVRRGMSYGPLPAEGREDAERGLVFMAYNASIAEQFEVIQRWLAGGNSSGIASTQSDPFLGVPQAGEPRVFRFVDDSDPKKPEPRWVDLDQGHTADALVTLEWGLYLLAPSLSALAGLRARRAGPVPPGAPPIDIAPVLARLALLEKVDPAAAELRWKALLEDVTFKVSGHNAALWAKVRAEGGAMACPVGVLLGSKDLVFKAFKDESRYSVGGYMARMNESFGPIYLGLDAGPEYQAQASAVNAMLMTEVSAEQAFDDARDCAKAVLIALRGGAPALTFHVKELADGVLAALSRLWFDLPDGKFVVAGGWEDADQPARCPGHYTSPSRYFFSPAPGPQAERYGREHGKALLKAVTDFVDSQRAAAAECGSAPQGRLSRRLFEIVANPDQLARTLIGAMMGFLPTTDGSLRSVLYEWIEQRTLWTLQATLLRDSSVALDYTLARGVLEPALKLSMLRRPVPDLVWRTARVDHMLGSVAVKAGQRVLVGIVSATHEELSKGRSSVAAVFGGERAELGAPTHACPGYNMAMGALLGVLTALLEAGPLRPTGAPQTLELSTL